MVVGYSVVVVGGGRGVVEVEVVDVGVVGVEELGVVEEKENGVVDGEEVVVVEKEVFVVEMEGEVVDGEVVGGDRVVVERLVVVVGGGLLLVLVVRCLHLPNLRQIGCRLFLVDTGGDVFDEVEVGVGGLIIAGEGRSGFLFGCWLTHGFLLCHLAWFSQKGSDSTGLWVGCVRVWVTVKTWSCDMHHESTSYTYTQISNQCLFVQTHPTKTIS